MSLDNNTVICTSLVAFFIEIMDIIQYICNMPFPHHFRDLCILLVYTYVVFANVDCDITMTGMSVQGPQHVVVAVKFGFAFLFISFLPWMKVCSVCVLLVSGASPPICSVGTIFMHRRSYVISMFHA